MRLNNKNKVNRQKINVKKFAKFKNSLYICISMSRQVYLNKMKVDSDFDKISKIVSIFSIIKNGNLGEMHIRQRCVEVISYYVLFGYSSETRALITESLKISKKNLNQINSELTLKGYLVKDSRNYHTKHLSQELQRIKDYFLSRDVKDKMYMINLVES